jgi:NitT/TauT family transport system ATP-binding protein
MTSVNAPIVTINNLRKEFKSNGNGVLQIFSDLNLSLYRNQVTSIVGPSGCGKSTLLNIIAELDHNYSGDVDRNVQSMIGYIFQDDSLIPWKTVYENIILGLKLKDDIAFDDARCEQILRDYSLHEYRDYYPEMLSGGMRQKVALAQMLINDPELILLDEPFSSQDFFTKIQLENLFYKNVKEKQLSAVLVTHDIEEAIALSDRIIVISQKPCKILRDTYVDFRKDNGFLLPEKAREMASASSYFSDIYQTLKPELA